ncbi:peptidase [Oenococcus oeni]|uniref:peptidase n=1 Tax=Oenococcus oeni TaxID=1247 RepID=UPI000BDF18AB|nr:peptidase [Oenococcus oeni]PDH91556.1 peptidase [Oenococcus oeni]PDH92983.1 peptidase [Oenococcus oeni]
MQKNNLKKLLFPIISLFVVLLLIASSFTSIVDLYRPPIKDSVMKSQIPKNKKVTVNLSQTEFKEQAEEAINSWNSDLHRKLFIITQNQHPTIIIADLSNEQINKLSKDADYGEHILGVTTGGAIYMNAGFLSKSNNQGLIVPVFEHELGHVIGLKHINGDALMNSSIQTTSFITRYDIKVAKYILKKIH